MSPGFLSEYNTPTHLPSSLQILDCQFISHSETRLPRSLTRTFLRQPLSPIDFSNGFLIQNSVLSILMLTKRRGRFTPEEDDRLRKLIAELGPNAWELVSESMPERTVRQCRDRWCSYLSDVNKDTPWMPEEDALLLRKIDEFGPHWVRIAQDFPNRSNLTIKRRWLQIFHHQRPMLVRESLKPTPRRKPGAEQEAHPDLDLGERPERSNWISWDEISAEAFRESMTER
jgi:hypothetical protein